jgi:hypothetical protein
MNAPDHPPLLYIAGSPKSGTTLLTALLDGHPDLLVFPEETKVHCDAPLAPGNDPAQRRDWLHHHTGVARMLRHTPGGLHTYPEEFARRFSQCLASSLSPLRAPDPLLPPLFRALAATLGRDPAAARWWVEKTPRHFECAARLLRTGPRCRLVFLLRDPRAVYAARSRREMKRHLPVSAFGIPHVWNKAALTARSLQSSPRVLLLRFEDLVTRPEETLRPLCAFLDIPFLPALLQPSKLGNPWTGNSAAGAPLRGIDPAPATRWRSVLQPAETAWVESLCRGPMRFHHYPLESTFPGRLRAWLSFLPGESPARAMGNRLRAAARLHLP